MKKKYSKQQLSKLEETMKDKSQWIESDHTVHFVGPTSIQFPEDLLRKIHAVSKARNKPIHKLIHEWVKPFVEGEYAVLQNFK